MAAKKKAAKAKKKAAVAAKKKAAVAAKKKAAVAAKKAAAAKKVAAKKIVAAKKAEKVPPTLPIEKAIPVNKKVPKKAAKELRRAEKALSKTERKVKRALKKARKAEKRAKKAAKRARRAEKAAAAQATVTAAATAARAKKTATKQKTVAKKARKQVRKAKEEQMAAAKKKGKARKAAAKARKKVARPKGVALPKGMKGWKVVGGATTIKAKKGRVQATVTRKFGARNPNFKTPGEFVLVGGSLLGGYGLASIVDRLVATRAQGTETKPAEGDLALKRIRETVDAPRAGAQVGLAAVAGIASWLSRKATPNLSNVLAYLAYGSGLHVVIQGVGDYIAPKLFPAEAGTFGNRLLPEYKAPPAKPPGTSAAPAEGMRRFMGYLPPAPKGAMGIRARTAPGTAAYGPVARNPKAALQRKAGVGDCGGCGQCDHCAYEDLLISQIQTLAQAGRQVAQSDEQRAFIDQCVAAAQERAAAGVAGVMQPKQPAAPAAPADSPEVVSTPPSEPESEQAPSTADLVGANIGNWN